MDQFEASRASVREATRTLELAGLITIRPGNGGGAYVTAPNFDLVSGALRTMLRANRFGLVELYQARLVLEPGVAEIAAQVADAKDMELLRASHEEGRQLLERKQNTAPASYNFHFLLAKAASNNLLLMLISSLMDLVHKSDEQPNAAPKLSASIVGAHGRIVEAIAQHQSEEARRLTTEHLLDLLDQISKGTLPKEQTLVGQPSKEEVIAG